MDFPTCLLFTLYTRTRAVATLLIVVVLILVVPWYPVVSNQLVNQTFTYTYQNQSQTLQTQKVYTLPSIIFLQGLFQSGATLDQVSKNLGDVSLQADSLVHVQATQCQYCGVNISQDMLPTRERSIQAQVLGQAISWWQKRGSTRYPSSTWDTAQIKWVQFQ